MVILDKVDAMKIRYHTWAVETGVSCAQRIVEEPLAHAGKQAMCADVTF